jgi:hypothetical protein
VSARHTPGPWRHDSEKSAIVSETAMEDWSLDPEIFDAPVPRTVISTFGAMGGDDSAADAQLLAAAPEMLNMLQQYLTNAIEQRAAAKVYTDRAGNPSKADCQAEIDALRALIAKATN